MLISSIFLFSETSLTFYCSCRNRSGCSGSHPLCLWLHVDQVRIFLRLSFHFIIFIHPSIHPSIHSSVCFFVRLLICSLINSTIHPSLHDYFLPGDSGVREEGGAGSDWSSRSTIWGGTMNSSSVGILNPTACLHQGDTLLFTVTRQHYPQYDV